MKALTLLPMCALAFTMSAQTIKSVPPNPTSPASGEQMFNEYCAVCHGKDAKGDGPAATALKKAPADLTALTRRNQGKFPEAKVYNIIKGDAGVAAHGSREMPIWGDVFSSMSPGNTGQVQMRIANLTHFVEDKQEK